MKRLITITVQFYQLLLIYNIAFSILAMVIFVFDAKVVNAMVFLFAKTTGFISAVGLHYYSSNESYFYFRNAGYNIRRIVLSAFVVDVLAYLFIVALSLLLSHIC